MTWIVLANPHLWYRDGILLGISAVCDPSGTVCDPSGRKMVSGSSLYISDDTVGLQPGGQCGLHPGQVLSVKEKPCG